MKGYILPAILVLTCACRKTSTTEEGPTTVLKTKEFRTGVPVPNVTVQLFRCSNYDYVFGCVATSLFATFYTDGKGECRAKDEVLKRADKGILYSRSQYWETPAGKAMEPEAFVEVSLKASKTYPDSLHIALATRGETGVVSRSAFKAPKDTVVKFRVFGNAQNDVKWFLYLENCLPFSTLCDANSTWAEGGFTVEPEKFMTV
jgi:hypothetical protein